jgi:hypothetical protein
VKVGEARLPSNPGFVVSGRVLDKMFDMRAFERMTPSDLAKEAMRREMTEGDAERARKLLQAEEEMEYPEVAEFCRVIDTDTRTVVVDPDIAEKIRQGEKVSPAEVLRHSVQMWPYRIRQMVVTPLFPEAEGRASLYIWTATYDPDFLGYMAGVLALIEMERLGGAFL